MVERSEAEIFSGIQTNGNSEPARILCSAPSEQNIDTIVKFRGRVRNGTFSLVSELLCSILAQDLGLDTPTPFIVDVSSEFVAAQPISPTLNAAQKAAMIRSVGLNFGSRFSGESFGIFSSDMNLSEDLKIIGAEIFAFDVLVKNYDRKADNPNLLWNGSKFALIDHDAAFLSVLSANEFDMNTLELDKFYDHVLYQSITQNFANFERLSSALGQITDARLRDYVNQIPPDWLDSKQEVQKVVDYLKWITLNREEICQLIFDRIS